MYSAVAICCIQVLFMYICVRKVSRVSAMVISIASGAVDISGSSAGRVVVGILYIYIGERK